MVNGSVGTVSKIKGKATDKVLQSMKDSQRNCSIVLEARKTAGTIKTISFDKFKK